MDWSAVAIALQVYRSQPSSRLRQNGLSGPGFPPITSGVIIDAAATTTP